MQNESNINRRSSLRAFGKKLFLGLVLVSSSAFAVYGIGQYKEGYEKLHDLTVVGNGLPTVVQVHDTNCKYCQALRSRVKSVTAQFEEKELQVRIADIHTAKGADFARRFDSAHVTLLLFNRRGNLTQTLQGVKSEEEIEQAFKDLIAR